jgi:hypothetical protein
VLLAGVTATAQSVLMAWRAAAICRERERGTDSECCCTCCEDRLGGRYNYLAPEFSFRF